MNTQRTQWIDYPIFISSTFKDMDQERDIIKFDVIPRLNTKYRANCLRFHAIDLRVGINTEEVDEDSRENYVLEVCFDKIRESRPFFVGLLGERYGWVPEEKRWEYILDRLSRQDRPLLNGSKGRSVTEMEILYGAIGCNGQNMSRSVFMVRSKKSYDGVPDDVKGKYNENVKEGASSEEQILSKKKIALLKNLKNNILDIADQKNLKGNICDYDLEWNTEEKRFDGLEGFADILFGRLCDEIDKELKVIPVDLFRWQAQDRYNVETMFSRLVQDSKSTETSAMRHVLSMTERHRQLLLVGDTGAGASTVAACCYEHFAEKGAMCCCAVVGASIHSRMMRPILVRWIQQLAEEVGMEYDEKILMDTAQTSDVRLYRHLHDVHGRLKAVGRDIVFILDGIDMLANQSKSEIFLMWIEEGMRVFVTSHRGYEGMIVRHHPTMKTTYLDGLTTDERFAILNAEERRNNIGLPREVREGIVNHSPTPLRIRLLMLMFSQLSMYDFDSIHTMEGKDDISKINHYLMYIYDNIPDDDTKLSRYIIHILMKRMQLEPCYERMFQWMAASGVGLRESDIEHLLGEKWDPLHFHAAVSLLEPLLLGDVFTHHWKIRSSALSGVIPDTEVTDVYRELVEHVLSLADDDILKRDILVFCLVMAKDHEHGGMFVENRKRTGDDEMRIWYDVSTMLLLSEQNTLQHLEDFAMGLPPVYTVMFVYNLIKKGVHDIDKRDMVKTWIDKLLEGIPVSQLDSSSSYMMALLYMDAQQFDKYSDGTDRERYLQRAIEALKLRLKLDPNQNARNYYSVALSEMADIAMSKGDLDTANTYLNEAFS